MEFPMGRLVNRNGDLAKITESDGLFIAVLIPAHPEKPITTVKNLYFNKLMEDVAEFLFGQAES